MKLADLCLTAKQLSEGKTQASLKSQALKEAAERFQFHPSTASLTWANARYQRLLRENEYHDEDDVELRNGDYVRDTQGDSEVFLMQGDPTERRVHILDKNGSGWNIMPSRLVKVTDPKAIARWFPDQDSNDEF